MYGRYFNALNFPNCVVCSSALVVPFPASLSLYEILFLARENKSRPPSLVTGENTDSASRIQPESVSSQEESSQEHQKGEV